MTTRNTDGEHEELIERLYDDESAARAPEALELSAVAKMLAAAIAIAVLVATSLVVYSLLARRAREQLATVHHSQPEPPSPPDSQWQSIEVASAPYVPPPNARSSTPFDRAMERYVASDYAGAAEALAPLAEAGDARASFYPGG